ncbi:MAG: DUF2339 domain-containing protein [Gemmatimonadetes bacterium]|uniref:DUF2339 domain-containing protein n=1 Tax=Candidatus Kutchimonas denitrificans TaxID=3056748 RepID=A0AAE5CDX1_9BACT|nr:DUF2339 domain-containing protein [Gemmatimonadota bacterium]NIR76694.1 DUF2339 domain-containing protein [Candidatus Kutchimonas denitrificans]NIS01181.1 DUF2339 domain-containing protein [Gemmatimonadota bacterium]NIT68220.1 DUF2339 domain-containing protein [Gemmatimonadota bacterium]NIW75438.1 DUF2339 domain-containing protein [Gemmatimonadota bacterium]
MADRERERLIQRLELLEWELERFRGEIEALKREVSGGVQIGAAASPAVSEAVAPDEVASIRRQEAEESVPRAPPGRASGRRAADLEFWLGGRGLLLLGVAALVFAVGFFVKEAIERGWIGPTIRVLLGAGVGVVAVVAGERLRSAGYRTYGLWLAAGGFGGIYLSIWAATALYSLVPTSVGFLLMVAVVVAAAGLGLLRDSESFVALAAFGGYLAPLLLGMESASVAFSLGYLGLITGAGFVLAYRSGWAYLAALVVTGGSILSIASQGQPHLHGIYLTALVAAALAVARRRRWPVISLFAVALGWTVFWVGSHDWGVSGLLFSVYAAALWGADLVASLGVTDWVDAGAAADGGGSDAVAEELVRGQDTEALAREFCGLAVLLLPPWLFLLSAMAGLEASAYSDQRDAIGLGLALILGAVYLAHASWAPAGRGAGSRIWRSALGLALIVAAPTIVWSEMPLVRAWLAEGVALTGAGLALKRVDARAAGLAAFTLAVSTYWGAAVSRPPADVAFVGAWGITGLATCLGPVIWGLALAGVERPARWELAIRPFALLAAAVFFLGWGTVEIDRFFKLKGAGERWRLARDLSISAFWMVYAATLLVLGFGIKNAAARWLGLGMALVAALKVFAYDLANLSQLYRIVSFVLLAVVLLGLSFRYQKLRRQENGES